jgi:hypothetical protein
MASANTATVFVVDDDASSIRAFIQGLLKPADLRSEGFETAEKFLERKPLDGPSCLILDVSLPEVSGIVYLLRLLPFVTRRPVVGRLLIPGLVHDFNPSLLSNPRDARPCNSGTRQTATFTECHLTSARCGPCLQAVS